ncbi:hypothetical protein EYF80_030146 [Liparis tanakae]|uniref:Uncharacterized protein n=1 Tax=Liparis tanakae TaxID=230148 RepID=A0A4Z2H2H7_9TELE|nr:hypothetical protein EYF80_030146 [Liparis tanakae]
MSTGQSHWELTPPGSLAVRPTKETLLVINGAGCQILILRSDTGSSSADVSLLVCNSSVLPSPPASHAPPLQTRISSLTPPSGQRVRWLQTPESSLARGSSRSPSRVSLLRLVPLLTTLNFTSRFFTCTELMESKKKSSLKTGLRLFLMMLLLCFCSLPGFRYTDTQQLMLLMSKLTVCSRWSPWSDGPAPCREGTWSRRWTLGLGSAELHSSVERELWRANDRLAFTTLACVSWVKILRREAERESSGELKGEDSAEEQVSLSPPLK